MPEPAILFLQKRAGKAGAQSALARLVGHPLVQALRPVVVTNKPGWLTEECLRRHIACLLVPFPSSRTLVARLWGNAFFAGRVRNRLGKLGFRPWLIQANDHLEGLLALRLGRTLRARTMVFLRSSEMTRSDYFKYGCSRFDRVYAAGDVLYQQVQTWDPKRGARVFYDGLEERDFHPPKPKAEQFPRKILVVGSESHYKGWQDFAQALDELEQDPAFPSLEFDFTGRAPTDPLNNMRLERKRRARLTFIGRVTGFSEFVRRYDLVIHPSREETFGLAMVETLAAGVPLVCSRAGVIERIQTNPDLLFEPHDPKDQAAKLRQLWQGWAAVDFDLSGCQQRIRNQFMLDDLVSDWVSDWKCLST